ncbi:MAG TPA: pyridoxamine 5'-phosphate oxidase family protein [Acidimicrobiales bacterium]|nr:pyridoxamine 5'-phosphate oxidase family protein [Acidimicrobiales bacterium]
MYTNEEKAYLIAHKWAVLATGRTDGSPQQAMVGYMLDEEGRILISTQVLMAKWRNITRQPRVSVSIPDGRVNLVVYGMAETVDADPERAELSADVLAVVLGQDRPDPSAIVTWLDQDNRGIVRITPNKVLFHTT